MRTRLQLALLLICPVVAVAQLPPTGIPGSIPSEVLGAAARGPLRQPFALDSVPREIRPTHWKEGALIGGVTVGLGVALLSHELCRSSDNGGDCGGATIGGFLVGAVLGGFVGALVGGQFPKAEEP